MTQLLKPIKKLAHMFLSKRTRNFIRFDLKRDRARLKNRGKENLIPICDKLHFGCGPTKVKGWLNVDVENSDFDVDLASGKLPWADNTFQVALSQHVIEHLELKNELMPLLKELNRVLTSDGEIWLSCPDMEKICASYNNQKMADLIEDRVERAHLYWGSTWSLKDETGFEDIPSSYMVNSLFYQHDEHRNLFDFDLLKWTLNHCGFKDIERVSEHELLEHFQEFPKRGDDKQSLYVRARAT